MRKHLRRSTAGSNNRSRPFEVYSIYKKSEGGMGRTLAMTMLTDAGIECSKGFSPFVGQEGVTVYGGRTVQKKAEKILFG